MTDISKLALYSETPGFKNNNDFTDSFNISGSITGGVNLRSAPIDLGFVPDIADILVGFNGEWTKAANLNSGFEILVPGVGSLSGAIDTFWSIGAQINGSVVTVTAFNIHQVNETVTLSSRAVSIRLVDYSQIKATDLLTFDSRVNFLKRGSDESGLTGTAPLTLGGALATTTHVINHNLGYIPFFSVGAELNDGSTIWSANRNWEYTDSSSFGFNDPVSTWHRINTQRLEINIVNGDGPNAQSGVRDIYWAIYLDYR